MQRLYLKIGDQVVHYHYPQWGLGVVIEAQTSTLPGGFCMVRIEFRDGAVRSFINDLDDYNCCYYKGLRLCETSIPAHRARRAQ